MQQQIALDLDGVFANFTRGFTRIAYKLFSTPVGDSSAQASWMFEHFPQLGLDQPMCKQVWDVIKESPDFWADLDPFNVSVMARVNAIENKVFITNRLGIDPLGQSVRFLEKWGIENPRVVVAKEKGAVALDLGVVAVLDDYLPNVVDIKKWVPTCYCALLYTPYNLVHHAEWTAQYGSIALSIDHFLNQCDKLHITRYRQE